ncbi:uncharacterized protein TM35_000061810 [Trypanosoma theileri]|uniref:Uncharacterized protein n=1 Tax=Trypanosoma theileri TaxID=67003 RepID=A0A1X0P2K9_9TRYP|nr:uncharacterized protein TM35_000061810 [Trypanosoma theileri]ORC91176.1 hypothetical protein TM35_000061810 [Trypanosoma theileri]
MRGFTSQLRVGGRLATVSVSVPAVISPALRHSQCTVATSATISEETVSCNVRNERRSNISRRKNNNVTTSTVSFPLGNGIEVQLPGLSSLLPEDDAMTRQGQEEKPPIQINSIVENQISLVTEGTDTSIDVPDLSTMTNAAKGHSELEELVQTRVEEFHRFLSTSLPLLLRAPETTSVSTESLSQACHTLTEVLNVVDSISRSTGLRVERVFPVSLVMALWNTLPLHYTFAQKIIQNKCRPSAPIRSTNESDKSSSSIHDNNNNSNNNAAGDDDGGESKMSSLTESSLSLSSSSSSSLSSSSLPVMVELKAARRALALRTRDIHDLLSPIALVQVLLRMEHCGALSDDIIGPIGTQLLRRYNTSASPQHVAVNHLLSTRFVASAVNTETLPFDGDSALAFACLLGRMQVVNHFQLHRLVHTILLPAIIPVLRTRTLDETLLLELTKCYSRYAVSGSAVVQLTELWMPHIPQMTLRRCAELLRIIGNGGQGSVNSKSFSSYSSHATSVTGAEEDYLILLEAIMERAPAMLTLGDGSLSEFVCALAMVNSVNWDKVYLLAATVLEQEVDQLPLTELIHVCNALIHRNSHLPYHPLHARLARRLLSEKEALNNVKVANLALLSAALMLSPFHEEPDMTKEKPTNNTIIPLNEVNCALAVFRRHGTKLGLRAFVAGMCVSPLAQLPRSSQERIILHFTSISSAIEVPWLAKGIAAVTSQIPTAVDPVSVQRWFSRFTAVDVARQLDVDHVAILLNILSDDNYSRNCALAKQAITSQAGKLLLRENVPLESIAPLSMALQRADVFFPFMYSRICRVLLSNVRHAPWELLLPAFQSAADEFTRRPHSKGSVFSDVWEQLRSRIMEEAAASLQVQDVISAFNGFASLDVRDRPIFSVLLHQLWTIYQRITVISAEESSDRVEASQQQEEEQEGQQSAVWMDDVLSGLTPSALAVFVTTLVHTGDAAVVNTFMPWALLRTRPLVRDLYPIDVLHLMLALLTCFSVAATSKEGLTSTTNSNNSNSSSSSSSALWLRNGVNHAILHAVYDTCRDLFLEMYEDVTTSADVKTLQAQRAEWSPKVKVSISHVPRYLFAEILIALCECGIQDTSVATASAARLTRQCCASLPISLLVDVLMALCFHFPPPKNSVEMTEKIGVNISGGKEDNEEVVVDSTIFSSSSNKHDDQITSAGSASSDVVSTPLPLAPHQRFLPAVLNALWTRVEELQPLQMDAVLRCLHHYYGDRVDADFLERLQKHRATLNEVKLRRQGTQENALNKDESKESVNKTSLTTAEVVVPSAERDGGASNEITADDLFFE